MKTKKGGSPFHFLRVLRYARASRRYLIPGLVCIVIVALTYSLTITGILPVIKLIVDEQGVSAWVYEAVAEERLGALVSYSDDALKITKVKRAPPRAAGLSAGQSITALDGEPLPPSRLVRRLAFLPEDTATISLTVQPDDASQPAQQVVVAPTAAPTRYQWLRAAASWLPQGTTNQDRMRTLYLVVGLILTIGIIGAAARFFGEYLISLVAARTVMSLRRRMYEKVLRLPTAYFSTHGTSDLMARFVQDSQEIYRGLNFVFAKSLREPMKATFVFIAAMIIDWRITLVTVVVAPSAGLLIRKFGRIIRRANRRLLEGYSKMLGALEGALGGIRVVKGYNMEGYERRHLNAVDQHIFKEQLRIARAEALSSPVFESIGRIIGSLAILYFAQLMFEGQMGFPRFATLAACLAGMFDPVRKMSSFYNRMQRANAAMDRVFEVLDFDDETSRFPDRPAMPPFRETIEFRHVSFTYAGADSPALDGVNLSVRRGERIAFVGPNGSGKTTSLALLMRFFEPDAGAILFDGVDIRDYSIASVRRQMSLITQDTVIFNDTIANNIAYGREDLLKRVMLQRRHPERRYLTEDGRRQIAGAAKAAFADEFILEKPEGYDTIVGERGATLSGGQKQRLAIARAILCNAPIFIFDEATSQIDAESEHKIHDAVHRFLADRTAFIVAHRFSTILEADRIVVMDRGRIVDSGRHDELIRRCTVYRALYGSQIIDDLDDDTSPSDADASPADQTVG